VDGCDSYAEDSCDSEVDSPEDEADMVALGVEEGEVEGGEVWVERRGLNGAASERKVV
jgi:hypothetical protein